MIQRFLASSLVSLAFLLAGVVAPVAAAASDLGAAPPWGVFSVGKEALVSLPFQTPINLKLQNMGPADQVVVHVYDADGEVVADFVILEREAWPVSCPSGGKITLHNPEKKIAKIGWDPF
jgi:hypothetical protein